MIAVLQRIIILLDAVLYKIIINFCRTLSCTNFGYHFIGRRPAQNYYFVGRYPALACMSTCIKGYHHFFAGRRHWSGWNCHVRLS